MHVVQLHLYYIIIIGRITIVAVCEIGHPYLPQKNKNSSKNNINIDAMALTYQDDLIKYIFIFLIL